MYALHQSAEAKANHLVEIAPQVPGPSRAWTSGFGPPVANDLIKRLSSHSRRLLLSRCELVRLGRRQVLQERGLELRYAYFMQSGTASLTARAGDCSSVEIRTLGKKDFVGVPLVLGMRISPHRCTVQVAGEAFRLAADDLVHFLETENEIERLLLGYVQAALIHSCQLVACNSRHSLNQRLARWLLVTRDRLCCSEIALTHRAMAQALAVRRAGITNSIAELERAGAVRRSRGTIIIADEKRLEEASCDCYRVIRSAHERALVPAST
jgi:CRP-like cAMP-binding protein